MRALILVVDDEPDIEPLFRQQFRRDLREQRFDLLFALSGEAALALLSSVEGVDVILLLSDVNMPGMTGLELVARVREIRPDLPMLMITAYADEGTKRRATGQGAKGVMSKPIDFAALRAELDACLDQARRRTA